MVVIRGKKRNIKVRNQNNNDTKNCIVRANGDNKKLSLKSNGLGRYKYPTEDKVPEGNYVSKIIHVKELLAKDGTPAIEVYYKMEKVSQCYQRCKGTLPKNYAKKLYYVKQMYKENTEFYYNFLDAMSYELYGTVGENVNLSDVIAIEEIVRLEYQKYSPIGGFSERDSVNYEFFLGEKEDSEEPTPIEEPEEEIEEPENVAVKPENISYDDNDDTDVAFDDFDDFLDDIDDDEYAYYK